MIDYFNEFFACKSKYTIGRCADFKDVEFTKDFGPWKQGDYAELLCFNSADLTLAEFDTQRTDDLADGTPIFIKSCQLTLVPKEPQ